MPAKKATKRGKPASATKAESIPVEPKPVASPLDETFVVSQKKDDVIESATTENGSNDEPKAGNSKTEPEVAEAEVPKKKGKPAAKKTKEKAAEKPVEEEVDDKEDVESTCKYCTMVESKELICVACWNWAWVVVFSFT